MADEVAGQRRGDDHRAAHSRRAALGQVPGRAQLRPDLLAVTALGEELDGHRGAEQREEQRDGCGQQDGPHRSASSPASIVATPSRWAARDAFTRTTSPGFNWFARASSAAAPSGTASASPVQDRTRRAPARIGAASSPTAISPASSARAASSPMSSWLARDVSPSSAMWPRTANPRPSPTRWRRARKAAATDSGLALYASLMTVTP